MKNKSCWLPVAGLKSNPPAILGELFILFILFIFLFFY